MNGLWPTELCRCYDLTCVVLPASVLYFDVKGGNEGWFGLRNDRRHGE